MSISGIGNRSALTVRSLVEMRAQLDDLQRQLGTGLKAKDYAGLGIARGLAVGLRARLSAIGSFNDTITNVGVRLQLAQTSLSRISTIQREVKSAANMSTFDVDSSGQTTLQKSAVMSLDEIIGLLNERAGDRYLFSGRAVDRPATETLTHILDGDGARAGLKQLIAERNQADLGTNGLGRLAVAAAAPAQIVGTGASLLPDAPATTLGGQNLSALISAGGTLVINGTPITINPGDDATAVLAAIGLQSGTTGVGAALNGSNQIVLTSADADTAISIGAGSTAGLLSELGLAVGTSSPTNLLTQGAVSSGETLTIAVGANPPLSIVFGLNFGEVSTLAELGTALAGLTGGTAAVDVNGNISITAGTTSDSITLGGTVNAANFGIGALSAGPPATVALSEDVVGSPFGFKLAAITSDVPGAVLNGPAGAPASVSINLSANPSPGQMVRFTFSLPDGSSEDLTLKATNSAPPGTREFAIGTTPDVTAANLRALVSSEIGTLARSSLAAASGITAARNFFDIDAGVPPQRVAGPPFDTATALIAGTSADTVFWYTGEMGTDPARGTAVARADDSIPVSYGARANEEGLRWTLEHVATFATMTFPANDPDAKARFLALAQRLGPILNEPVNVQSVTDISAELAGAQTALMAAKNRHEQTSSALEGLLDSIEGVSKEEVGATILALQTRLQASLQTTAMLYQTSIINYL